jgi:hypothetical protein
MGIALLNTYHTGVVVRDPDAGGINRYTVELRVRTACLGAALGTKDGGKNLVYRETGPGQMAREITHHAYIEDRRTGQLILHTNVELLGIAGTVVGIEVRHGCRRSLPKGHGAKGGRQCGTEGRRRDTIAKVEWRRDAVVRCTKGLRLVKPERVDDG